MAHIFWLQQFLYYGPESKPYKLLGYPQTTYTQQLWISKPYQFVLGLGLGFHSFFPGTFYPLRFYLFLLLLVNNYAKPWTLEILATKTISKYSIKKPITRELQCPTTDQPSRILTMSTLHQGMCPSLLLFIFFYLSI